MNIFVSHCKIEKNDMVQLKKKKNKNKFGNFETPSTHKKINTPYLACLGTIHFSLDA